MTKDNKNQTNDMQLIQQHLANERTFLSWVRTAVAVVGLGFLGAGVAFRIDELAMAGTTIAAIIGIGAVVFGGAILAIATKDYLNKRTTINEGMFRAPRLAIWVTFTGLGLIDIFLIILVVLLFIY